MNTSDVYLQLGNKPAHYLLSILYLQSEKVNTSKSYERIESRGRNEPFEFLLYIKDDTEPAQG